MFNGSFRATIEISSVLKLLTSHLESASHSRRFTEEMISYHSSNQAGGITAPFGSGP